MQPVILLPKAISKCRPINKETGIMGAEITDSFDTISLVGQDGRINWNRFESAKML